MFHNRFFLRDRPLLARKYHPRSSYSAAKMGDSTPSLKYVDVSLHPEFGNVFSNRSDWDQSQ